MAAAGIGMWRLLQVRDNPRRRLPPAFSSLKQAASSERQRFRRPAAVGPGRFFCCLL